MKTLDKNEITYGYRYSHLKCQNVCILSAVFKLRFGSSKDILEKMNKIYSMRRSRLPVEPSAGSVFKRPNYSITVGEMLEKINIKGYQIGGAQISLKHGGVIINKDNASGKDIIDLISYIKEQVYQHYHIELELEQIII